MGQNRVDVVEKFWIKGSKWHLPEKLFIASKEDNREGVKRTITEINANDILLLGKKLRTSNKRVDEAVLNIGGLIFRVTGF